MTWAASLATLFSPTGGVVWDDRGAPKLHGNPPIDYAQTKACNTLMAKEFADRYGETGVVSNAWNPGNLSSELQRHQTGIEKFVTKLLIYETKYGGKSDRFLFSRLAFSDDPGEEVFG